MVIYRVFPRSNEQIIEYSARDPRGLPLSNCVKEPLLIYPGQQSEGRLASINGNIYYSGEDFITGMKTRADHPGHLWEYFLYP